MRLPRSIVLILGSAALVASVQADPLDKVNGMEDWSKAGPENIDVEWRDWYRGRIEWRRASRDLRVQRVISARLAPLLERADPPTQDELRRIIRAGMGSPGPAPVDGARPAPQPKHPKGKRAPAPAPRPAPAPAPAPSDDIGGEGSTDRTPDPPTWTKVPVEKLDKDGQAVDDEGARELQRATGKKKRRK